MSLPNAYLIRPTANLTKPIIPGRFFRCPAKPKIYHAYPQPVAADLSEMLGYFFLQCAMHHPSTRACLR